MLYPSQVLTVKEHIQQLHHDRHDLYSLPTTLYTLP